MSNVFARNHTPTGYEFIDTAEKIEIFIHSFVKSEKNIPKRSWFSHGLPLFNMARKLNVQVSAIRAIFPTDEHELQEQRDAIQAAINTNEGIITSLKMTVRELQNIDCNKLDAVGDLLLKESECLRGLKSKAKIVKTR